MRGSRCKSGGEAGIGRPLACSAAGHLLLMSVVLLAGHGTGREFAGAVEVYIVEEHGTGASTGEIRVAGSATAEPPEYRGRPESVIPPPAGHPPSPLPAPPAEAPVAAFSGPGAGQEGDLPVSASAASSAGTFENLPPRPGFPGGGTGGGAAAPAAVPSAGKAGLATNGADILLLRQRIESRIVYPEEAIRRGQEGEVLLRIRVGEGGIPKEIRVARSSGARSLDDAARVGVARAAPLPSTSGWFEVPVRFHLR